MSITLSTEHRARIEEFRRQQHTGILVLVFTDMVGSTQLKQNLGDQQAVAITKQHHAVVRELLDRFPESREIDTAGDSFFLVFVKPSDAVKFALQMQSAIRKLAQEMKQPLADRIGIHAGEVFIEDRQGSRKPLDLFGIQVDSAARVMSLAEANQILVTRFVFDNARQLLRGEEFPDIGPLSWLSHGPYMLKGVEEPLEICEVGETGVARLGSPPDSEKAHRHVPANADQVLGWRPAVQQTVPNTQWVLDAKLGEGGFGEVWLAKHKTLKDKCVFKFCFRANRVRSLKREVTLFKVLRERAGNHPGMVSVRDVFFDEPPYYIIMDYAEGLDLGKWIAAQGGMEKVPLSVRLEIVVQIAGALQVAHEAGIVHRDVKPSNIIVCGDHRGSLQVKLTDFGIGQIISPSTLAGVTVMGFTQTTTTSASDTGTPLYMAPELVAGKPASPKSDIYSLGVVFYQLAIGDLSRPVTMDWAANVDDPLLRHDLAKCFAGNPDERFKNAASLLKNLREIEQRRKAEELKLLEQESLAKKRRFFVSLQKAALLMMALALVVSASYLLKDMFAGRSGAVEVRTVPDGAEVWMNGVQVGKSPYQASFAPGVVGCELRLAHYETLKAELRVAPKATNTLLVFLNLLSTSNNTPSITATNAPLATFLTVEGTVEVLSAGAGSWRTAGVGTILHPKDRVRTGKQSRATIRFSQGYVMRLNELTELAIPDQEGTNQLMKFFQRSPGNGIKIQTTNATAVIRG